MFESMYENTMILSEGIGKRNLEEVPYLTVMEEFKNVVKMFNSLVKKSLLKGGLDLYPSEKLYPEIFVMNKNDMRTTIQQHLSSRAFSIYGLARDLEITERLVMNEINDIVNQINYENSHVKIAFKETENTYYPLAILDFGYCMEDLVKNNKPKVKKPMAEIAALFKELTQPSITTLKKHPLSKNLSFNSSIPDDKLYKFKPPSGMGIAHPLQTEGFLKKDFDSLVEKPLYLDSYMMHLMYYLEESLLQNTVVSLICFDMNGGAKGSMFMLASKPNVKVI